MLENQTAHGYELIRQLDDRSNGFYVPSPGMVYPSLTFLEETGLVECETEANRKRYRPTNAGLQYLRENQHRAHAILESLREIGLNMESARRALAGERSLDEETQLHSDELRACRQELKTFLRTYEPKDLDEDARITGVLRETLSALRGQSGSQLASEQFLALAKHRRSSGLSKLKPDSVDRRLIERMLEAANWAPSHGDTEPWSFTVFTSDGRAKLAELFLAAQAVDHSPIDPAAAQKRAYAAPVWISIGLKPQLREDGNLRMPFEEELMAVACAVQNLHLMAQSQGLAGMWHSKGSSIHPEVARGLGLEPPSRLLGFFMCGWPAVENLNGTSRPISDKVTWIEDAHTLAPSDSHLTETGI